MSWKKYGGTDNLESINYITTKNIVTDNLTLRNPYVGVFTICGDLIVSETSTQYKHSQFNADVSIKGDLSVNQNVWINDSLYVFENVDVSHDVFVHGNTFQYNPLYFVGGQGQGFNRTDSSGMYLLGDVSGIAINKTTAQSTFDIYGTRVESLNVFTDQSSNRNILSRNNNNSGVVLFTDNNASYLELYHQDLSINAANYSKHGGGRIYYKPGALVLDTSTNINLLCTTSISNRTDALTNHVNGETLAIYDISKSTYLSSIYDKSYCYTGVALSLISSDLSSNTFLKITNTDGSRGWGWNAGVYPTDVSRSMTSTGWFDVCSNYIPSQMIVSGNSTVNNRFTIGINTYNPETEKYIMDINGPLHLHHNEIYLVQDVSFEILSTSFSKRAGQENYGVAVGSFIDASYQFFSYYTTNGGKTWSIGSSIISDILPGNKYLNTELQVYMYDISHVVVSSNPTVYFFSDNYGRSWQPYSNFNNVNLTSSDLSNVYNFTTTLTNVPNIVRTFFCYRNKTVNTVDCSGVNGKPSNNFKSNETYDSSLSNISSCHGSESYLYIAGTGIESFDISSGGFVKVSKENTQYNYRCIRTLDGNFAVAAGDVISYTYNHGISWNNYTSILDISFLDICVYDLSNVIIVGNNSSNGVIIFSTDSAVTWNRLTPEMVSSMGGNSADIFKYKITSIAIQPDLSNAFIITSSVKSYGSTPGRSYIYYLYFSYLFNRQSHPAMLDICGNMVISGDVNINEEGRLCTTNTTFYILDQNAQNIYFGNDASNIHIGQNISGGNTYIRHRLDISDNVYCNQQLLVHGLVSQIIRDCSNTTNYGYRSFLTQRGPDNTAIGYNTLNQNLISGFQNTAVGSKSMQQNLNGTNNSAFGFESLQLNLSGGYNTAVGSGSLQKNVIGNNNSALGFQSLYNNVSGDNSAFGFQSLQLNLSGGYNTAVGSGSLQKNVIGNKNSALGFQSLYNNVSGDNTAFGFQSLYNNVSGGSNSALGYQSLYSNVSGEFNSAIGFNALYSNSGNYNSSIGYNTDISGVYSNSTAIGAFSKITNNHQIVLGTSSEYVYIPGNNLPKSTLNTPVALVVEGDVSFNRNAWILDTVYAKKIEPYDNGDMNIGTSIVDKGKTIKIGSINDTIILYGTVESVATDQFNVGANLIQFNYQNNDNNISAGAGIYIRDYSNDFAGYIKVSGAKIGTQTNLGPTSYIFKAPGGPNVVHFDISSMIVDGNSIPNTPHINTNMVMKIIPSRYLDASFSIVASSLDISSIFIKNIARSQDLLNGTQMISTNVGISGNLFINKDPSGYLFAALDVSGNVIASRLGIGTNKVPGINYNLEVSGNATQTWGWIHQF
jgi:hypothetical protein